MPAPVTVDDRQFRASVRELSRVTGRDYADLLHDQAAAVVKILARDKAAKPPSVARIRKKVEAQLNRGKFSGPEGDIAPGRGGAVWYRPSGSAKWRMVFAPGPSRGWHLAAADWQAYQKLVKARQRAILAETRKRAERRGLLRMSFIQIADAMGVRLANVSGAAINESIPRRARMPSGRLGNAARASRGAAYHLDLSNASIGVRGRRAAYWQGRLQAAITRRARAMETDMRKGVFADVELRAKKYPGIYVRG